MANGNESDRLHTCDIPQENIAYLYLCHVEEARIWIQTCIQETLPVATDFVERLRNGVYLAKLGHFLAPNYLPLKKVFDASQDVYEIRGLNFRHTDNINHWIQAMRIVGLPSYFYPEVVDVYGKKKLPKVIYCIHALSIYLYKLGRAPHIQNLYGKVQFTSEEINAVLKDLAEQNIDMPSFGELWGILSREINGTKILAPRVNAAGNVSSNCNFTLEDGRNKQSLLTHHVKSLNQVTNVENCHSQFSSNFLPERPLEKTEEHLSDINLLPTVKGIQEAVVLRDCSALIKCLAHPNLNLKNVCPDNVRWYMKYLSRNKFSTRANDSNVHIRNYIQQIITMANEHAIRQNNEIDAINKILRCCDCAQFINSLKKSPLFRKQTAIYDFAAKLYYNEFSCIQNESGNLSLEAFQGGIKILSAVALINKTIQNGNSGETFRSLSHPNAHISELIQSASARYQAILFQTLEEKVGTDSNFPFLTHFEIQNCIDEVNQHIFEENEQQNAQQTINSSISSWNEVLMLQALLKPSASIMCVEPQHAYLYLQNLATLQMLKKKHEQDGKLQLVEIQHEINCSNKEALEAKYTCIAIISINMAIEDGNNLMDALKHPAIGIDAVIDNYAMHYKLRLLEAKENKNGFKKNISYSGEDTSLLWVHCKTKNGHDYYFNQQTLESSWTKPSPYFHSNFLLKDEIQRIIFEVNNKYLSTMSSLEIKMIRLQAYCRGYLIRKAFAEKQRCETLANENFKNKILAVIQLQSYVRMWLARKKYLERKIFFKEHEAEITKIQIFWRRYKTRQQLKILKSSLNPSLKEIKKCVHFLQITSEDYAEDLQLLKVRTSVVQTICHNEKLEKEVNDMDVKIALLVRNRISLQEVLKCKAISKKKDRSKSLSTTWLGCGKGLKALSKESRARLELYQDLFYTLQSNPSYLVAMLFILPPRHLTKFVESIIFSLFNYGCTPREEYLLLHFFSTALEKEISLKAENLSDVIISNSTVVKMVIRFNRIGYAHNCLQELLKPLVTMVMSDQSLQVNLNPVDIYKLWINEIEIKTGKPSGYPYHVNLETAIQHDEVKRRLNKAISSLKEKVSIFCDAIAKSLDKIPYGMLYIAKTLKKCLSKQFPKATEKELLKIVGNLIYYHYINSAIAAPDAFDIIELGPGEYLTDKQRRNLGCIAKILQFSAAGKGFGQESSHLMCLNKFIKVCHEKCIKFFQDICNIEEPEEYFNIEPYSDAILLTQPTIQLTVQEICDIHELLLKYKDDIIHDETGHLQEILDRLGSPPTVNSLLGENDSNRDNPISSTQSAQTEVCLTLTGTFAQTRNDTSSSDHTYAITKLMIIDILKCFPPKNTILEMIHQIPAEETHFLEKYRQQTNHVTVYHNKSIKTEKYSSLADFKKDLLHNLNILELEGYVSEKTGYQEVLNSIATDISNRCLFRQSRKKDLIKLKNIKKQLDLKTTFFEEKLDYYNQYIHTCLDNLASRRRRKQKNLFQKGGVELKYSGLKLHEKGILLQVDELDHTQLKNLSFQIVPTEGSIGVFAITATFIGVALETVEVDIQELLRLQYEGVAVMDMFGRAKVNVNLLLYLLNSKFYGKNK